LRLNEDLCHRREYSDTNSTGKVQLVNSDFLFVVVVEGLLFCVWVCVCFVCFRSRSYPVPHRGERVKQRMVHAQKLKSLLKLTATTYILVEILYLLGLHVCGYVPTALWTV
jgi:hypothetical protein